MKMNVSIRYILLSVISFVFSIQTAWANDLNGLQFKSFATYRSEYLKGKPELQKVKPSLNTGSLKKQNVPGTLDSLKTPSSFKKMLRGGADAGGGNGFEIIHLLRQTEGYNFFFGETIEQQSIRKAFIYLAYLDYTELYLDTADDVVDLRSFIKEMLVDNIERSPSRFKKFKNRILDVEGSIALVRIAYEEDKEFLATMIKNQELKKQLLNFISHLDLNSIDNPELRAVTEQLIKNGLIEDISKSSYLPADSCRDKDGKLQHLVANQSGSGKSYVGGDICVDVAALDSAFPPLLDEKSFSYIIGLFIHDHARHIGYNDKDHQLAIALAKAHRKLSAP